MRVNSKSAAAKAAAAALVSAALCGCGGGAPQPQSIEFFAMDTYMRLDAYGPNAVEALGMAREEIERLDRLWSVTDPGSEIFALNRYGGAIVSPETLEVIRTAADVSAGTGGALDITVYPAVKAWGFTAGDAAVPPEGTLRRIMPLVDYRAVVTGTAKVELGDGMEIDLGAVAKGYASQRAVEIFAEHGVSSGIVSLGGNVQALGSKPGGAPWIVAIQDPEDMARYAGTLEVRGGAVVTSGVYQRYFEEGGVRYHHIIDPATCRPAASGLLSATVVAPDGARADALSTALLVMGEEAAVAYWRGAGGFDMILINESGGVAITAGIAAAYAHESDSRQLTIVK
jgi:thiamine biosynthesis lipoprotein